MPGGLEMLYHAPLVTGPNPVLESAAGYYECLHDAGEDGFPHATVTGSCAGSFNPIFDEGVPMVPMGMDTGWTRHNRWSCITWCAVVMTAHRFKDFFISAMEDFQETPKVVDAAHKLGLDSTSDVIPGLEVQLMPHQLIGVSWMVEREAKANIKGGILA